MTLHEKYFHWYLGENILRKDDTTCLVNFKYGIGIFFAYKESYFSSFEEFFESLADVQFFSGDRPNDIQPMLEEAWNFLCEFEQEEENIAELNSEEYD